MKIKSRLLLASSSLLMVGVPMSTSVSMVMNKQEKTEIVNNDDFQTDIYKLKVKNKEKQIKWKDNNGNHNFEENFNYFSENKTALDEYLSANYQSLSDEASQNIEYQSFIEEIHGIDLLFYKSDILEAIKYLDMNDNLKLFLLQNFLDKVISLEMKKTEAEKEVQTMNTRMLAQGPIQSVTWDGIFFDSCEVMPATAWNINDNKGEIDPITGQYFSKLLYQTSTTKPVGWKNNGADSSFWSVKVKMNFYNRATSAHDYFYLVYNTAQDTNGTNEDYSFVGIAAKDWRSVTHDRFGMLVPSIFDIPLSFNLMPLRNAGASIDNPYMMSAHEVDAGSDNHTGNILHGLHTSSGQPYITNAREGSRSLYAVAESVKNYVEFYGNQKHTSRGDKVIASYNKIDNTNIKVPNYLIKKDKMRLGSQSELDYVRKTGSTYNTYNWNLFADDNTNIYWSNETVAQLANHILSEDIKTHLSANNSLVTSLEEFFYNFKASKDRNFIDKQSYDILSNPSSEFWKSNLINKFNEMKPFLEAARTKGDHTGMPTIARYFINYYFIDQYRIEKESITDFTKKMMTFDANGFLNKSNYWIASQILNSFVNDPNETHLAKPQTFNTSGWADDHGLVEWDRRMNTRLKSMIKLAIKYSDDFNDSVKWLVNDSWTDLPKIYIASSQSSTYKQVSYGVVDLEV